jgi:hypothetical protein
MWVTRNQIDPDSVRNPPCIVPGYSSKFDKTFSISSCERQPFDERMQADL